MKQNCRIVSCVLWGLLFLCCSALVLTADQAPPQCWYPPEGPFPHPTVCADACGQSRSNCVDCCWQHWLNDPENCPLPSCESQCDVFWEWCVEDCGPIFPWQ